MFCYYTIGFFLWTYPCHSALYSPLRLQVHWRIAGALCLTILRTCRGYCMHVLYCFVPKVLEKFYRTYINFSNHVPNHHDDPGNFPLVQVHMAQGFPRCPFQFHRELKHRKSYGSKKQTSLSSLLQNQKISEAMARSKTHVQQTHTGPKEMRCTRALMSTLVTSRSHDRVESPSMETPRLREATHIRKTSPIFDQNAMETPLSRGSQSYVQIQRFHRDTTSRSSFCRCFKQVEV